MFMNNTELMLDLLESIKSRSETLLDCTDDPVAFSLAASALSATTICYEKVWSCNSQMTTINSWYMKKPVPPYIATKYGNRNTIYHICTRASMYDELYNSAKYLAVVPKELLEGLKSFGDRVLSDMEKTVGSGQSEDGPSIDQSSVYLVGTLALKHTLAIMANAKNLVDSADNIHAEAALATMVNGCKYLERIGIQPSTAEGMAEVGNVWFDLQRKRQRHVNAKLIWFDIIANGEVETVFPISLGDVVRRDRNS